MIRLLAVNEMSLRGDKDTINEHFARGKFLNLFEFVASKDEQLAGIAKTVPANAKYSSLDIQNKIISIMCEIVRSKVHEVHSSDGGCYTIKCDGTRDKDNEELSIVVRLVKDGESRERLLQMTTLGELDTQSITTKIMSILESSGCSVNCIISQCYNGANVMSGVHGAGLLTNTTAF